MANKPDKEEKVKSSERFNEESFGDLAQKRPALSETPTSDQIVKMTETLVTALNILQQSFTHRMNSDNGRKLPLTEIVPCLAELNEFIVTSGVVTDTTNSEKILGQFQFASVRTLDLLSEYNLLGVERSQSESNPESSIAFQMAQRDPLSFIMEVRTEIEQITHLSEKEIKFLTNELRRAERELKNEQPKLEEMLRKAEMIYAKLDSEKNNSENKMLSEDKKLQMTPEFEERLNAADKERKAIASRLSELRSNVEDLRYKLSLSHSMNAPPLEKKQNKFKESLVEQGASEINKAVTQLHVVDKTLKQEIDKVNELIEREKKLLAGLSRNDDQSKSLHGQILLQLIAAKEQLLNPERKQANVSDTSAQETETKLETHNAEQTEVTADDLIKIAENLESELGLENINQVEGKAAENSDEVEQAEIEQAEVTPDDLIRLAENLESELGFKNSNPVEAEPGLQPYNEETNAASLKELEELISTQELLSAGVPIVEEQKGETEEQESGEEFILGSMDTTKVNPNAVISDEEAINLVDAKLGINQKAGVSRPTAQELHELIRTNSPTNVDATQNNPSDPLGTPSELRIAQDALARMAEQPSNDDLKDTQSKMQASGSNESQPKAKEEIEGREEEQEQVQVSSDALVFEELINNSPDNVLILLNIRKQELLKQYQSNPENEAVASELRKLKQTIQMLADHRDRNKPTQVEASTVMEEVKQEDKKIDKADINKKIAELQDRAKEARSFLIVNTSYLNTLQQLHSKWGRRIQSNPYYRFIRRGLANDKVARYSKEMESLTELMASNEKIITQSELSLTKLNAQLQEAQAEDQQKNQEQLNKPLDAFELLDAAVETVLNQAQTQQVEESSSIPSPIVDSPESTANESQELDGSEQTPVSSTQVDPREVQAFLREELDEINQQAESKYGPPPPIPPFEFSEDQSNESENEEAVQPSPSLDQMDQKVKVDTTVSKEDVQSAKEMLSQWKAEKETANAPKQETQSTTATTKIQPAPVVEAKINPVPVPQSHTNNKSSDIAKANNVTQTQSVPYETQDAFEKRMQAEVKGKGPAPKYNPDNPVHEQQIRDQYKMRANPAYQNQAASNPVPLRFRANGAVASFVRMKNASEKSIEKNAGSTDPKVTEDNSLQTSISVKGGS